MQKITFTGKTDLGKQRQNNEDAFVAQEIWDKNHILGVAIDGVGGYEGGEVAAEIAQNTIVQYLENFPNGIRLNQLKQAVTEANNKIVEERNENPKLSQMSCVLSACLVEVEKKQINMVHVGDTRIYLFYNNELTKLSHDHSYVGYREDIGDLTEEEAMTHPKRNEINRMVGNQTHHADDRDFIEAKTFPLRANSILLLCSDGLTDLVTKAEITVILRQKKSLEQKTKLLIDLANNKGGKDNITVVLIDYQSDEVANIESVEIVNKERLEDETANKKVKKEKPKKKYLISILVLVLVFLLGAFIGLYLGNKYHLPEEKAPIVEPRVPALYMDSLHVTDTLIFNELTHPDERKTETE